VGPYTYSARGRRRPVSPALGSWDSLLELEVGLAGMDPKHVSTDRLALWGNETAGARFDSPPTGICAERFHRADRGLGGSNVRVGRAKRH